MFEAKCPSCSSTYQVDERRVPPTGLKMRCPKCGDSFQVSTPVLSEPPVLGAVLGLSKASSPKKAPPRHRATMLGVAEPGNLSGDISEAAHLPPARAAVPPRPLAKKTMMGVAPGDASIELELAPLDDSGAETSDIDELDLSATSSHDSSDFDLPAAVSRPPVSEGGIDLPSLTPEATPEAQLGGEVDLPSLGGDLPGLSLGGGSSDEFDLSSGELPSLPDSIGLPSPVQGDDLPSPAAASLPGLRAELPELAAGLPDIEAGLPELEAGLPLIGGSLPTPAGVLPELSAPLPDLSAPLPDSGERLPELSAPLPDNAEMSISTAEDTDALSELEAFGSPPNGSLGTEGIVDDEPLEEFELTSHPAASAAPRTEENVFGQGPTTSPQTIPAPSVSGEGFGEVSLGGGEEEEDEFDAFPTDDAAPQAEPGQSGQGYGDVSLGGDSGGLDLGADIDRGEAPDGFAEANSTGATTTAAVTAQVIAPSESRANAESKKEKTKSARRKTSGLSRNIRIILGGAIVFAVGGGALSFLPEVGPYGYYFITDTINAQSHRDELDRDIRAARKHLALDSAEQFEMAFAVLNRGRGDAPRYKPRAAFAAYLGELHQLRFGASSSVSAQGEVLLNGLAEAERNTRFLQLARLTRKAAGGASKEVATSSTRLLSQGPDFARVVGEAALNSGQAETAANAWKIVLDVGKNPAAHFGMARAMTLLKKADEARLHIDATLEKNPQHAGARLLLAEIQLREREKDGSIVKSLKPLSEGKGASPGEQVQALVILGDLHLSRSRIKKAETVFTQALKLNSGSAPAQRGLAQALFDSGRYTEALTRFEASLQRDPESLSANLGLVRSKMRLEQMEDAVKQLALLEEKYPDSSAVLYWVGMGKDAVGEKKAAEAAFKSAIEKGEVSSELVRSYIALTRLLSQRGEVEEANQVIAQAESKFPSDPAVYEALGDLSTSRGSYDDAVNDFEKALELDKNNIGLLFSRAIALRQARRFDEAARDFDSVDKQSPDYPGLALERGNLFEASGRSDEALEAYEKALAAAPQDLDLMLRVACGRAGAGQDYEKTKKLLDPVLEKRGNSAEANFCKGLSVLNGRKDFQLARRHLARAVARDASRAKYHLYVGWVAMELKDYSQAGLSLDKTIELDRTLADAYWKRGDLRGRQGAVRDALEDLDKALELAPSRLEVYASKARALLQLGKEVEGMAAWAKAVSSESVDPTWNRDYGALLLANQRAAEARVQLQLAVDGAMKRKVEPIWLPDARRLLAMAIGRHKDALPHWNAFLKAKQGTNNPYLREAMTEAKAILNLSGF